MGAYSGAQFLQLFTTAKRLFKYTNCLKTNKFNKIIKRIEKKIKYLVDKKFIGVII